MICTPKVRHFWGAYHCPSVALCFFGSPKFLTLKFNLPFLSRLWCHLQHRSFGLAIPVSPVFLLLDRCASSKSETSFLIEIPFPIPEYPNHFEEISFFSVRLSILSYYLFFSHQNQFWIGWLTCFKYV